MKGTKYDQKKLKYNLFPLSVLKDIIKVLMHGAKKYSPDNWKKVEPWDVRYYNAAKRHLDLWWEGHKYDGDEYGDEKEKKIDNMEKSGLHHLSHAICCLIFLRWKDDNAKRTQLGD